MEGRAVGIGPVLSFVLTLGKANLADEPKWLPELSVETGLKGDIVRIKLGFNAAF